MFFWKRKPKESPKPYIVIKENGLGEFSMKFFAVGDENDYGFLLVVPENITTREQAENYAKEWLENRKRSNTVVWKTTITQT